MELFSASPEETERAGRALAETLRPGSVVAICGGLGAGKTAFVRGIGRGLFVTDRVTSPTFNLVHEYRGGRLPLVHFDLYRLSGEEELYAIGWDDYLDSGAVCAVEWAERAEGAFPPDTIRIRIEALPDGRRRISREEVAE